jgi:hypothetical protein
MANLTTLRAALVQEYELPGGVAARLKRVGLMDLAERGEIPDTLSGVVVELLQRNKAPLSLEEMKRYAGAVNLVVKACFVEPRVTDEPTEETLGVGELPFALRLEIYQWANDASQRLRPFRGESPGPVQAS